MVVVSLVGKEVVAGMDGCAANVTANPVF
jgi:hypothetical protein